VVAAAAGAVVLSADGVPFEPGVGRSVAGARRLGAGAACWRCSAERWVGPSAGTAGRSACAAGWFLVAEGVVPVVLRRPEIADHLPGGALAALLAAGPGAARPISPAAGALALLVLAVAAGLVAAGVGRRREL
jgi:hypothetical protein